MSLKYISETLEIVIKTFTASRNNVNNKEIDKTKNIQYDGVNLQVYIIIIFNFILFMIRVLQT